MDARLLSWREGWSVLPAIFGETRVVQCKQLPRTDTCRTRPRDSCQYPSCCENWFYQQKKERKIAMQLCISKYSDLQGYVFTSLWFKLFAVPQIKRALQTKRTFPKDPQKQQALTSQHTTRSGKRRCEELSNKLCWRKCCPPTWENTRM